MKIYVVGIGPGSSEYMTPQARAAIEDSDVVVGYTLYVDLVSDLTSGKEVKSTAMKQEVDRCRDGAGFCPGGKECGLRMQQGRRRIRHGWYHG